MRTGVLVKLLSGLVIGFLLLPVLIVIPMSFSSSEVYEVFPANPSLLQYRTLFSTSKWIDAGISSLQIACATTVIAITFGTIAALALRRLPAKARSVAEGLMIAPRIVPSIVFAVAAYSLFLRMNLVGTPLALVIAHSIMAFPFAVVAIGSALASYDERLSEASLTLGASPLTTFLRITFPQIRVAVFGAAIFSFSLSFDEVVVTLFLSGVETQTIPVVIWNSVLYEVSPVLPAVSTIIVVLTTLALLPAVFIRRVRL